MSSVGSFFSYMQCDDGNRSGFSSVLHEGVRDSYVMSHHLRNVGKDQPDSPATLRPEKQRQVLTVQDIGSAIVRRRERFLICSWDRPTISRPARSPYQVSYPGCISQYVVRICRVDTPRLAQQLRSTSFGASQILRKSGIEHTYGQLCMHIQGNRIQIQTPAH